MNKHIKKKWAAELRSGKYKQTSGQLFKKHRRDPKTDTVINEPSYCCLGVLTKLYCQEKHKSFARFQNEDALPPEVAIWAGIKLEKNPEDRVDPHITNLKTAADLNDVQGCTFKEIAGYIERSRLL